MKIIVSILIFCFVLTSCSHTQTNNNSISTNRQDTVTNRIKDSIQYLKDSLDNAEPDLKKLRQKYINDYSKVEKTDTTFIDKDNNQIHVLTKYYCLFDNAINIPGRYVWEDTTKSFKTHNYSQDIKIIINKDTIFNKTVTKKLFADNLFLELKQYAILSSPTFNFDREQKIFDFGYSISIPFTDVGVGCRLLVDEKGNMTKTDR